MSIRIITVAAALGVATATATAGSLDRDAVSADATWVVHVDMERLAESTVGRFLREHGDDLDIDLDDLDAVCDQLDLDPWRDVMSVTVYGAQKQSEDGVMVLETSDRIHEALRRLGQLEGVEHESVEFAGFAVERFAFDGEEHYVHVRTNRRSERSVVVLADASRRLVDACRVISGERRSLSRGVSPLSRAKPRRGSFVFVAASDAGMFDGIEEASEIVRLTDAVMIDIGETGDDLYAAAMVSADSGEDARDIVQVLQGMLALGRLAVGEDPDLAPLRDVIRGVEIGAEDRQITLGIQLPAKQLIEALEGLDDQGRARDDDDDNDDDDDEDWDWDDDDDDDDDDDGDRRERRRSVEKRRR